MVYLSKPLKFYSVSTLSDETVGQFPSQCELLYFASVTEVMNTGLLLIIDEDEALLHSESAYPGWGRCSLHEAVPSKDSCEGEAGERPALLFSAPGQRGRGPCTGGRGPTAVL